MKKIIVLLATLSGSVAFAQEGATQMAMSSGITDAGLRYLAVAIGFGLAAIGVAGGQGRAASAALDGIARNPGSAKTMFVPFILAMALPEAIAILGWLFLFLLK